MCSQSISKPKAVLVGIKTPEYELEQVRAHLLELSALARTGGLEPEKTFLQCVPRPVAKTRVGSGKLAEIQAYVQRCAVRVVIFDDDLSPAQVRNLEHVLHCKVIDRTLLILNIFALHARTARAKAQVGLAQYKYMLTRLPRMWTHLSRQKGGIGMRGPGEKELETDRRAVHKAISRLRVKLDRLSKQTATRLKQRHQYVRVALVGYTNTGKSTLMCLLSKSDASVSDALFVTLNPLVRRVVINQTSFLLTDTVGFIRKLPHTLVECFKSTLDEVRQADLLLHVVDCAHASFHEHIQVVQETLQEISAAHIPRLLVFNKIDQVSLGIFARRTALQLGLRATLNTWSACQKACAMHYGCPVVFVSAQRGDGVSRLQELLCRNVRCIKKTRYPYLLR